MENKNNPRPSTEEGRQFMQNMAWITNVQPVVEKYAFIKETVIGATVVLGATLIVCKFFNLLRVEDKKDKKETKDKGAS